MISTRGDELPVDDAGNNLYGVDIVRPDITEETIDSYRALHHWIEETEIEIVINGVYGYIDMCLKETQYYLGGGFQYWFWFFSQVDLDAFTSICDGLGVLGVRLEA
jgi:hypothetical protein